MKKIMYFAAALLLLAGCQSSQEARENAPAEVGTITGTIKLPQRPNKIAAPEGWKTAEGAFTMQWESTDKIYIFNESGCKELTLKSIDDQTGNATFEGELLSDMSDYKVAYGYDPNVETNAFTVPYVEGNYRPFADGTGKDKAFEIKNFGPVVGLQLKGADALSKIETVLSDKDEKVLATYTMAFSTALALKEKEATNVYFPIQAKEGATSMAVNFYKTENSAYVLIMTKTAANAPAAGTATAFPELEVQEPYTKTVNGHKGIQLWAGGPYWATMNVGATIPEGYGDYFAWGETEPYYSSLSPLTWKTGKEKGYAWSSYKYMQSGQSRYQYITKYTIPDNQKGGIWYSGGTFIGDNKTVLESTDDAATVNWGSAWRMPTDVEWTELREKCTWTWTDNYQNTGVAGCIVTSKAENNTKSIFLPAAGSFKNVWHYDDGSQGDYWSASLDESGSDYGYGVYFTLKSVDWTKSSRCYGWSVRAVCK